MEGFDDSGEEGAGQKLLHLLEKMGVENIMIVVCAWHSNPPGQFGSETFKVVLERAKELLSSLHLKVLEAEKQALLGRQPPRLGTAVTTKVYQSSVIPDRKDLAKRNYRPNNFLAELPQQAPALAFSPTMPVEEEEQLEIELTGKALTR